MAVDLPKSTPILGRAAICRVICFTSRPTGPPESSYHVTSLQMVSPGVPKKQQSSLGESVHGQKYIASGFSAEIHHAQGATASSACVVHLWQSPRTFSTSGDALTLS